MRKKTILLILIFTISILFVFGVEKVWSHSFVINESPAPNTILEESPTEIVITFDSEIDKNLVTLKVIDEEQREVTSEKAQVTSDGHELRLPLLELPNGTYTVNYQVISSNDGHPIRGKYLFKIDSPAPPIQNDQLTEDLKLDPLPVDDSNLIVVQQTKNKEVIWAEILHYIMRTIYYIGFIMLIGWLFWWRFVQGFSPTFNKRYLFYGIIIQMIHLLGLITMILIQLNMFSTFGFTVSTDFPFGTTFGLLWFLSLFLSLIGFLLLFRNTYIDIVFMFLLILSKSLNGHAIEFEPMILLSISNFIHLITASIWMAGIFIIVLYWRKYRIHVQTFLPRFSKIAFYSIIILSMTGTFTVIAFTPISNLVHTDWGVFLLIKLMAVLFVISTGIIIRLKLKQKQVKEIGVWIKLDFTLSLIIIGLVAILTYLNPYS